MSKEDDILQQAKDRFKYCQEYESATRVQFLADLKFGNADSTNGWQWDQTVFADRQAVKKPTLTVNRTRQYCLNIINDARQNKPEIEIRAVGDGSSFDSAQIFQGIIRHIESISNSKEAYDAATWSQVFGGIGWFRIVTEFPSDNTFQQEIYIRRVTDALSIYGDPHASQQDGSDMQYAFVFRDLDRKVYEKSYPQHKDLVGGNPFNFAPDRFGWVTKDRVRVAEYYRIVNTKDTLHFLDNGSTVKESEVKAEDAQRDDAAEDQTDPLMEHLKQHSIDQRDIQVPVVEHYLIAGDRIIESGRWAGRYIPLIRVIGEETIIDGRVDRKGHVRALIDPQRAYNYYTSAGIEFVALQAKTPWIAPVAAIEGYEADWANANITNPAILPYNHMDDQAQPIPPPQRQEPPSYASAFMEGMKVASSELELASGQPDTIMGMASNERSAKAIQERTRGGATQTYHFINNLSVALRFAGKILLDLVPRIYDVPKVMKILALDGTEQTVQVDPSAPQAHAPAPPVDAEGFDQAHVSAIFNPLVGSYDVVADNGPDFATRRQQAFAALSQIITQNEQMAPVVADLWARSADFPLSNVLAERLARMVPAQATGQGPPPEVIQLQQQLAAQHQVMQNLSQELQVTKSKQLATDQQKDIDVYDSETRRLAVISNTDKEALKPIVRELVSQILGIPVNQAIHMHMVEQAQAEQQAAQFNPQPQNGASPQSQ